MTALTPDLPAVTWTRDTSPPCAINPRLWDSTTTQGREAAARICRLCPQQPACQDHALTTGEPHGTWGGLTSHQRAVLRHGPDADDPDAPVCGTPGALRTHRLRREHCQGCEAAHRARLAAQWRAALDVEHAKGGTPAGHRLHTKLRETPCQACRNARNRADRLKRARRSRPAAAPVGSSR